MYLEPFFTDDAGTLRISAAQGSAFAKEVAGDFNPLHDADNPRFCAPGDLLFALVLARQGLASRMVFRFTGMVGADVPLTFSSNAGGCAVTDASGKTCLEVTSEGEVSRDGTLIESLVRRYVAFSGQNFPHILVPLMEQQGVMIHPERPLVIYECMSFELNDLSGGELEVSLVDARLETNGRRGEARLGFRLHRDGETVGHGAKSLVLSGLREHDSAALKGLVERYAGWKAAYLAANAAP